MRTVKKNEEYAAVICDAILGIFDEENENSQYKLDEIDGTEFFTGMIKAAAVIYDRFTGNETTFLEFTHMCNTLIVQDMIDSKGGPHENG